MRRLIILITALLTLALSAEIWARYRLQMVAQVRPGMRIEDVEQRAGVAARTIEPGTKTGCHSMSERAYIYVVRGLLGPGSPFILCVDPAGIVVATGFVFDSR